MKLPDLFMFIKQISLSLPRNWTHMTLGALLTVFSTELKIFYLAFLMLTELFNMCLKEFYFPDY